MNTRCPLKRVPSAARFFTHCEHTVQPPQSYSVGGQRSSGQLTGKPAGAPARLQGSLVRVLCAKNLAKKDFFRLPDPFAKIVVDGSGQCHSTDTVKSTLDPKWNQHYDLYIGKTDSITISVWNHKKIHKKQGAGFLGCDHLSYFHFVGRIMGLAVFHGHYINGGFTLPFYKQLLGKPIQLSDLETVDPELHKSLVWILENDITPVLDHTFCVEHNAFGKFLQHELKPNGRNIPVTEENKKEYVRLYVNWRFMRGIEAQFLALQKGFNELIPQHLLKPFEHKELELIIGGLGKLDLNDWKANTRLKHCVADSNMVKWFWQAVESFDEERRGRLLQFVTGSTRVPLQGFKALQGSTGSAGPRLFTIHLIDANTDNLPKAHTCFNRIDIPPYETYEKLYEKLVTAVEETCGFAVE
ncbi:UNVERIFIED_CONTAM: hypothetical protein FKN15_038657 [Acipenser sinensis]